MTLGEIHHWVAEKYNHNKSLPLIIFAEVPGKLTEVRYGEFREYFVDGWSLSTMEDCIVRAYKF
jgi:hypothetical protein